MSEVPYINYRNIIIGQEAICPDGLGRVVRVVSHPAGSVNIYIDTYVDNRQCGWASHNITLIKPGTGEYNYVER